MKIRVFIPDYTDIATVNNFNDMYKAMIDGQLISRPMSNNELLTLVNDLVIKGSYEGRVSIDKRLTYVITLEGGQE